MGDLMNINGSKKVSSVYLVEQVNIFRREEFNNIVLLHKSLLAKIENEFSEEIEQQIILPSSYLAGNGKREKCYELDFEQSLQLLMGESKTVRKKCVAVIVNKSLSVPTNFIEAMELATETLKRNEVLLIENSEMKPKIVAFDNVIDSANTYTLDSVSDILNIGRTTLSKVLEQKKWKTVKETNGTSSTRYAEENGYAKTVYEYIKINGKDIKTKRIVLKKKGLDKLIKEQNG